MTGVEKQLEETYITHDSREDQSPSKELPTKVQKIKRSKSRRSLQGLSNPVVEKMKKNTSPKSSTDPEAKSSDSEILSFSYIFPKSDCDRAGFNKQAYPPPPPYPKMVAGSSIIAYGNGESQYKRSTILDNNEPLDMSKKCMDPTQTQQQRPSVITCASSLLKTHCQHRETSDEVIIHSEGRSGSSDNHHDLSNESPSSGPSETTSGMCDSVIDEHFRRSLGKDYSEIFSSANKTSVSVTVDDHFAKALGDTWLRLQEPNGKAEAPTGTPSPVRSPVLKQVPSIITL